MSKRETRSPDSAPIIVIAPPESVAEIRRLLGSDWEILAFESVHALDQQRRRWEAAGQTIEREVAEALGELDVAVGELSVRLQQLLTLLAACQTVPDHAMFARWFGSRTTLWRRWREELPETPARFLSRVRRLHQLRLTREQGLPRKEATFMARIRRK